MRAKSEKAQTKSEKSAGEIGKNRRQQTLVSQTQTQTQTRALHTLQASMRACTSLLHGTTCTTRAQRGNNRACINRNSALRTSVAPQRRRCWWDRRTRASLRAPNSPSTRWHATQQEGKGREQRDHTWQKASKAIVKGIRPPACPCGACGVARWD